MTYTETEIHNGPWVGYAIKVACGFDHDHPDPEEIADATGWSVEAILGSSVTVDPNGNLTYTIWERADSAT